MPQTNYALSSQGSTISTNASNGTPAVVINGLRHTNNDWLTQIIQNIGEYYAIVDFGQNREIGELRAYGLGNPVNYNTDPAEGATSSYAIKNHRWERWDGSAWQTIVEVTDNATTIVKKHILSSPVTTSKIRFTVLSSGDGWGYLVELEALSVPPDTTPPTDCEIGTVTVLSSTTIRVPITTASTDAGAGLKRYKYEIDTQNDFLSGSKTTGYTANTTSPFDIPGLSPGFSGFVHFKGEDNASPSNFSNNWSTARAFTTWNAAPTITNPTQLSNAQLNQFYSETIVTAGGNGTRTLSVTPGHTLPAWLSLVGNNLTGTHNALATDELIYLRVTDANGQYNDYVLELSTVDEVIPSDVATLVVSKDGEYGVTAASSGATDNSGSVTFINQRSNDNFVSNIVTLASTAEDFTDTVTPTVETTYKWRQKAKDGSNNVSANWKVSNSLTFTPPPVPEIISNSPLPYARTGHSYTFQLQKAGGSGLGEFLIMSGNLPEGALDENGLITIADVGDSNYTFTVRYLDENGTYDDKNFTIPVSDLAVWNFCAKYPYQFNHNKKVRMFKPRQGARQTRTDAPKKRKITINLGYFSRDKQREIIEFWDEHYPEKNFLFYDDYAEDYFEAYISTDLAESRNFHWGNVELVIEEV